MVISGCLGPRGDGYVPDHVMSVQQAQACHHAQIKVNSIGTARAAQQAGLPMAISFTVETNGHLPTGQTLKIAIAQADEMTAGCPTHDMRDCAIPCTLSGFWSEAGLGWRGFGASARTPHNGATPP